MKKTLPPLFAALVLVCLSACEPEDVGVPCKMASSLEPGTSSAQINPQAMDCRSRLCLLYGGLDESKPLCTRICKDNGDCPDETDTCKEGFTCIPATETTKLACCKMCVCKRFVTNTGGSISTFCDQNPPSNCPDI